MPTRSAIIRTGNVVAPEGGAHLVLYTQDSTTHNNYEVACLTVVAGGTNINTTEYVPVEWGLVPVVFYWKIA